MERTISDFCRSPLNINSESCREILSNSSLDSYNKKNCQYYIVHTGDLNDFNGAKENEHVINLVDLRIISKSITDKVEEDTLSVFGREQVMEFG